MSEIHNILIIKWGALGDIVSSTVAIKAIHEHFPAAKLVLLTNVIGVELFDADQILNDVLDYKTLEKRYGKWGAIKVLKRQNFDLAVNLRWHSARCGLIAMLTAKKSVGCGPNFLRPFYHHKTRDCFNKYGLQEYELVAQHAQAIGCEVEEISAYLQMNKKDQQFAKFFFHEHNLDPNSTLLLAPSASNLYKCWSIEKFISLCQKFNKKFPTAKILLNWMPGDEALVSACKLNLQNLVLQPKTTVTQVCALVELSTLILCNASGLMNVGYAYKKPIVCLNTTYNWTFEGENVKFINAFAIDKAGHYRSACSEMETKNLLSSITVDTVWQVLESLWDKITFKRENA